MNYNSIMFNVLSYLQETSEKFPNKIAISCSDVNITFRELKEISSKLGSKIQTLQKNNPIGVFVNRSINPIVYFLAVLYSSNYFVPIDIDMKLDKIQSIINDASFEYILGDLKNKEIVEKLNYNGKYLSLEDAKNAKPILISNVEDSASAYMVYTSGSTGKPKGVVKSHKAVASFIETYVSTFNFTSEDVIGNQTPFFFDASFKDLFLMLKTGATLEIIPSELFPMPTSLIEYMNDKKITFISWVPTALSIVAQLNPFSFIKPKYLKKVFFVGEVMSTKHLNKWINNLPNIMYVNMYGQSELAGICCYYEVGKLYNDSESLPIGKPLNNCKIYLVDKEQIITDINHIGEIYIVSNALASKYYNDSERTKKSFVYKDFGEGKQRAFKTGDYAKYDKEGNLVFASRSDYQIKHMGYRIELGEIEVVANSLNEINRSCCLYNNENHKIVLFVELNINVSLKDKQILSILRNKLSSYMVPNKVIILDKLPINPNGKIDRQKLKEFL